MQAHLVLPLLFGDQGPTGQCPRAGTQVMGVDTVRGHPPGSALSWGASRTHRQPELTARGKLSQELGAAS